MGGASPDGLDRSLGKSLDRKFWAALGLYAVLAVLAWFTIGEGTVAVLGRQVEIRWIPVFVLGMMAFRTWVAMKADRIRRGSGK